MIRYHARWVLPVTAPPVERGTVAVSGSRIAYVGPRAGAPDGADEELGEAVLLPGLVNAHTRLGRTGPHPAAGQPGGPDASAQDGEVAAARRGLAIGLAAGTTTFGDSSRSGASLHALRDMQLRGVVFYELTGPDPADRAPALTALASAIDRLRADASHLVQVGVAPHSVYGVHEDLLIDACAYALGQRLPIALHVAQSDAEISFLREGEGPHAAALRARGLVVERRAFSPVHLLVELGIDIARPLLLHCTRLDPSDVAFIAERGCPVVHCPGSDAALGHGIAPVAELLAAGAVVGLGTGAAPHGAAPGMLDEARVALLLQRAHAANESALSGAQALALATIGGARALGLDGLVGSLEVGKEADLAAFPLGSAVSAASADVAAALLFAVAGRAASFVAVAGRPRVRGGRVVTPD